MAKDPPSLDVDNLRDEFESSTEWSIRRKFLLSNFDSLSLDRLLCLSRCLVNVAVYGCSYPLEVMKELSERSAGILEEVEKEKAAARKEIYSASFIKASGNKNNADTHNSQTENVYQTKSNAFYNHHPLSGTRKRKGKAASSKEIQFVKASESLSPDNQKIETRDSTEEKMTMLERVDNPGDSGSWVKPLLLLPDHIDDKAAGSVQAQDIEQLKTEVAVTSKIPSKVSTAQPLFSKEEYFAAWKAEKDVNLIKFRKLAYEVMALKNFLSLNTIERLQAAVNKVPLTITSSKNPRTRSKNKIKKKNNNPVICHVFLNGIKIASGEEYEMKNARIHAYEAALQKIFMPYLRLVNLDDPSSAELHASVTPFSSDSQRVDTLSPTLNSEKVETNTAKKRREDSTNNDLLNLKQHFFREFKPIEDFVIVEPLMPDSENRPTCTLERSASFNQMIVEYDYLPCGDGCSRCILKIEGKVLADMKGVTKPEAKNEAAAEGLKKLRQLCWTIKIKKVVDSDFTVTKEEMLSHINEQSNVIYNDNSNIGNKMLRKMGWSGGGVGKDGSGISEPITLTSVFNRQGFGLDAGNGVTGEFRKRVREVIQNYAASSDQEDLMFSNEFSSEQRKVIHDISRKFKLQSKSRGKGQERYLCIHRKRTSDQLISHIMSCGGETAKYKLVPPGETN
ncbi:uncharacterized protein LOC129928137 isoform X3 [Biomphalaria glabrata]|nr:uncharacterized protein LOC129928137 isoform X3 [Biomphalaria glabrata]XP_055896904.1 uncharacterized protein LOC129928137 isoform X3 [Biomphalaria glabrata]XP_055896905.1 uncharacterized protein LOC129928137 isoform X3 [Biomphalaria glabrata]